MKKLLVLAPILPVLAVLLAWGGRPATPVYACTGSTDHLTLDHYVAIAQAIAVVDVSTVGEATNETPPLPPGTPLRDGAGPGGVPDGFEFSGIGATGGVRRVLAGAISGTIGIDATVRKNLEVIARRWEAGERMAPCFFGAHRYEANMSYLAFFKRSDAGWDTVAAYVVSGSDIVLPVGDSVTWRGRLILGDETYHRFFSSLHASNAGPDFTNVYGDLWRVEQRRVPLDTMITAITSLRASITPPTTGDAGLR